MKYCLDANLLLDYILVRDKYLQVKEMLSSLKEKPFISILTVHIIHYFAHKEKIQFELITRFLENFTILPLSETDYLLALSLNSKNDFEDTLQIACCISNDCDLFLTLDKKLYKKFVHLGIVKLI